MPNKYSHGLVLSQQQYRGIINTNPPLSLKPSSSSPNSRSRSRSTAPSIHSPSNHSTQSSGYSDYLRLEPDPEPEPSYHYDISSNTRRQPLPSAPSPAPQFEPTSSECSHPSSDRLRLEPSQGFRIETSPLPPPQLEPMLSERPHYDSAPSQRPNLESSSPERLRLATTFPLHPINPRPSLHHKSSSVETQIFAPEATTSPPPTRERRDQFSLETHEPYPSPPPTHERQYHSPVTPLQERQGDPSRPNTLEFQHGTFLASTQEHQHVFSMESPENSPPPISTGHRQECQERLSSETQRAYLPSPTRDRQQSFIQKTQALASPPLVRGRQAHSPFGTPNSPSFPSARELQDYFSIDTLGSQSIPAAIRDRQDASSMKARSALPTPPQDGQVRSSMDIQRLRLPQTQDYQRRPSLGTQHFSHQRRFQNTQESVHGRRQSIDSQTTRDRQPFLDPRHLSWDQSIKETQHSWRQSIESKSAQERQPRPSSNSQELSLEQFIRESEHIREPSVDSQIHAHQMSSYARKSDSRQASLANTQRYTPNSTSLEHGPRSRWDRPSKLPDTFAPQHRTLLPTSQGSYDQVLIETHGFPPERPPSPPATPNSSKSFSLTSQAEGSRRTRPPPIPQRSARRSPPRQPSILRSTDSSVVYLPLEPPRPKTSSAIDPPTNSKKGTALHSPTFSISTRGSSVNAITSPQSVSFSNFSETMTSPRRVSFSQSRDREYFEDADLEPLPSEIDFKVLPYEDPNAGPAIFRATQLGLENPVSPRYEDPNAGPAFVRATQLGLGKPVSHDRGAGSSRSSSFDSAAPPPIGLNRRISHAVAESHQLRAPKKESKMSLLSFLRSTSTPKAVLYSEATQGKPPVPVSVSRTNVPSIPLLFPGYRGQFPPPPKMQDKGLRSGLEPRTRPGLETRASAPRSTAHADAAEKRKSWIKGDDVDKARGENRQVRKGELERILSRI